MNPKYKPVNSFLVAAGWLVDTGCLNDFVPEELAHKHKECVYEARPYRFNTAKKHIESAEKMNLVVPPLKGVTSACILPDTPAVLTMGGRNRLGYTFAWVASKLPCWITPTGEIVPLSVINDVPYLEEHGTHETSRSNILRSVGLSVKNGKIWMNLAASNTAAAALYGKTRTRNE